MEWSNTCYSVRDTKAWHDKSQGIGVGRVRPNIASYVAVIMEGNWEKGSAEVWPGLDGAARTGLGR